MAGQRTGEAARPSRTEATALVPAPESMPEATPPRVLIGGVGYRWVSDGSFGLVVSDELMQRPLPLGVEAMDLGYGAIFVTEDLRQAQPQYTRLVLVTAAERGRTPGELYQWRWDGLLPDEEEIQACVREAGAGIIDINHLLVIAGYFRALPAEVVVLELEPVETGGRDGLSPAAADRVAEALDLACREACAPLWQAG